MRHCTVGVYRGTKADNHCLFTYFKEAHGVYFGGSVLIGYHITASSVIVFLKVHRMNMPLALSRMPKLQIQQKLHGGQNAHFQYKLT
jgi:hypothetical protein